MSEARPGTPGTPGGPPVGPAERRTVTLSRDLVWPVAITLFLVTVVVVNLAFIYVAVSGQDEVVPSYVQGER